MYFFQYGAERTFGTFDLVHIIVIIISFSIVGLLFYNRKKLKDIKNKDRLSYILASVLLFLDFSFYVWKWINGAQETFPIPMHICSWATYIVAIGLYTKNHKIFQVGLYYGFIGGFLSILVPEFGGYSYDHMRFYQFFLLHIMILVLPLYQYFTYRFKLEHKMIFYTLLMMWGQAVIAYFVNMYLENITGEPHNGMFVNEPPVDLPGILGQSPVYLAVFSILFILIWNGLYKVLTCRLVKEY